MTYEACEFFLPVNSPFRLDLTVWALRRRKTNIIDRWDGSRYARIIVLDGSPVKMTLSQEGTRSEPRIRIALQSKREITNLIRNDVRMLLEKMLGLTVTLQPFYAMARSNDILRSLAERFQGVRPPRFPSVFEALINAIACQQVTLDLGIVMLGRLSRGFGKAFTDGSETSYAFPRPGDLTEASAEDLRKMGFSRQKAEAMKELATALLEKRIVLAKFDEMNDSEAINCLTALRGIGRWSAEYVLLRGLGRIDSFPGDDIGAQNNIERVFHLDHRPGYEEIKRLTSQWHPYEGLVYFHLLLEKLHEKEIL